MFTQARRGGDPAPPDQRKKSGSGVLPEPRFFLRLPYDRGSGHTVPPRRGVRTASEVLFFRSESGEILESDGKVFDIHHFQEVESFACERETDAFDFDGISDLTIAAFMALPLPVIFAR